MAHSLVLGLCCWFGYCSARATYAGYLARYLNRTAQERAIAWTPENADYYAHLAKVEPRKSIKAIQRSVQLNPRSSSLWIQFGEIAETQGDLEQAEKCLLEAVKRDKTFAPRWLLSEFYFRRRNTNHFWPALKAALATSYDDVTPLFEHAWELSNDAELILSVVPERPEVLDQYLTYIIDERKSLDTALPVADRLARYPAPASLDPMLNLCDRLLENGRAGEAVSVWNSLSRNKLVPYPALDPGRGAVLTNARLVQPFLGRGFDWRVGSAEGLYVRSRSGSEPLRFGFSGRQPESLELLTQWLPLAGGRRYELRTAYNTGELEGNTGLSWRVLDAASATDLLGGRGRIAADGTNQGILFDAPRETRLARLVLAYSRVLGRERIAGWVALSNVRLEARE